MHKSIDIQSYKGEYNVTFDSNFINSGVEHESGKHYIIDSNVAKLYSSQLGQAVQSGTAIIIEAIENNKSLENIVPVIYQLIENGIKRDHTIIAIGGGIIQDITCYIASTLMRGVNWTFIPTTLLSQADSCIGSKSSINLGETKNILGTFNPPHNIIIDENFLKTLDIKEVYSGVGEMIKVHAIDGSHSLEKLNKDYSSIFSLDEYMQDYIFSSLEIKKKYIEEDEFDKGIRNIFNYGHSFGHAIEAATKFAIPHGIAVTIGMDMANYTAYRKGLISKDRFESVKELLDKNIYNTGNIDIPFEPFLSAIKKDKKNTSTDLVLILPVNEDFSIEKYNVTPDEEFEEICVNYFNGIRNHGPRN